MLELSKDISFKTFFEEKCFFLGFFLNVFGDVIVLTLD